MTETIIFAIFLGVHFVCAQIIEDPTLDPSILPSSSRQRPSDPVSVFLSGLGNLILDIDETFSRQTAPKVNTEDEMKEQMHGRPRSGTSYFNRIRENYRDIQRRLGESLGILDLRMSSDLGSVNVQNKGSKSLIDVSVPSLPMKFSVSSNQGLKASENVNDITDTTNVAPEQISPRFTSSLKLGNSEINMDSKMVPLQPPELLKNVENQIKKALEDIRITNDKIGGYQTEDNAQEKSNERLKLENELDLSSKEFSSRSGSEFENSESLKVDDSGPEGRILGDVLYSESTFDTLTKRVMRDAKWAIDPKVFPSRVVEKLKQFSDKATENITPKKTEKATISRMPKEPNRDEVKQDFKKRKSLKPMNNDLETILNDRKISFIPKQDNNPNFAIKDRNTIKKDSIILAFTPEGVPLKLRMGPEILNPLKFLHKVLSTYGVSLNIPVVSYDDIEPVGREILQLGIGSGGTMTRALYIDLSDSFQLKSLVRTLSSTKMLHENQNEETDQEGF